MAGSNHHAKFILSAKDETRAAFKSAERHFKDFTKSVFSLKGALLGLGAGVAVEKSFSGLVQAQRDIQKMHYSLLAITGSAAGAKREFDFLNKISTQLGLNIRQSLPGFARLEASAGETSLSTKQLHQSIRGLFEAFTVLGTPAEDVNGILTQLDQGLSLGSIHMQDLRAIAQHIPGMFGLLNQAFKGTGKSIKDMLAHGGIPAEEFFVRFANVLHNKYGPQAAQAVQGIRAQVNLLQNALFKTEVGAGSSGFVKGATEAIKTFRQTLEDPQIQKALGDMAAWLGRAASAGATAVAELVNMSKALAVTSNTAADGSKNIESMGQIIAGLGKIIAYIEYGFKNLGAVIAGFVAGVGQEMSAMASVLSATKQFLGDFFTIGTIETASGRKKLGRDLHGITQSFASFGTALKTISNGVSDTISGNTADLQLQLSKLNNFATHPLNKVKVPGIHFQHHTLPSNLNFNSPGQSQESKAAAAAKAYKKEHDWVMNLIDPLYQLRQQQMRLDLDYQQGTITARQYVAASEKIAEKMQQVRGQTKQTADSLNQFTVQAAHNLQDILGQTILNVFEGKGNVFQSFAQSFTHMIEQVIAQLMALQAAKKLFGNDFATGKSNNIGGIVGGIISFFQKGHSGAIVGSPNAGTTAASPLAFAGAPRFHGGGMLGLKPNEVPFIGLKGEEVLTQSDPRHTNNGGRNGHAIRSGAKIFAPRISIDASGAGPTEYANFMSGAQRLRQQLHRDYEHFHQFGDWPE